MDYENSHLADQQLLLDVDGELPPQDEKLVRRHLEACWKCRARRQELENAIAGFIRVHQREVDAKLPPIAGPRALLKARLAQLPAAASPSSWFALPGFGWGLAAAMCALVVLFFAVGRSRKTLPQAVIVSIPNPALTPGAALLAGRREVCSQPNTKNKTVPVALQRRVFAEYGIAGAEPRAYEVDYLVTPALGGADDIHNLWPHSHFATIWNAGVKDALEDRLREMVCDGDLDLNEAQREIATNWIAAYRKYFHTDSPLAEHRGQDTP